MWDVTNICRQIGEQSVNCQMGTKSNVQNYSDHRLPGHAATAVDYRNGSKSADAALYQASAELKKTGTRT